MNHLLTLFLLLSASAAVAQPARLINPSFEGEPRDATIPRGWFVCEEGTTPDILPGPWGVYNEPHAGETYVGLITRENGTWESIGQKLSRPLDEGECHNFTLSLARSDTYMGYDKAIKIRIWGGTRKCNRDQLIAETERIQNTEWEAHSFQFTPEVRIKYIIIEAFHKEGSFNYAGNVLIDNITPIRQCGRSEVTGDNVRNTLRTIHSTGL
jgi:hypothetical protein